MNSLSRPLPRRERLHGLRQIVRFNWPFYAVAAGLVVITLLLVGRVPLTALGQALVYSTIAVASLWLVASLAASWIVYDHSILMAGDWIPRALGIRPRAWINIHTGLDETTPILQTLFGRSGGRVFDMFDPAEMTEPSIARARRLAHNQVEAEAVDFRHLPVPTASIDAAVLFLSAHELRRPESRLALFTQIHRALRPGGRLLIAEHLRDWPNFVTFGPGFLHFHSRRTWTHCFERAGFAIHGDFSITPFVRIFVLAKAL